MSDDLVHHPPHYTAYPVEVIELTEHLNFCRGNAVKYIARAGLKGGPADEITDLEKARWYIDRELARVKARHGDEPEQGRTAKDKCAEVECVLDADHPSRYLPHQDHEGRQW